MVVTMDSRMSLSVPRQRMCCSSWGSKRRGHANRATLQVARKLVAYLLAVDKSGQPFRERYLNRIFSSVI
jgi:hypothetical protein